MRRPYKDLSTSTGLGCTFGARFVPLEKVTVVKGNDLRKSAVTMDQRARRSLAGSPLQRRPAKYPEHRRSNREGRTADDR